MLGFFGRDLNKGDNQTLIPESTGIIPATIFIVIVVLWSLCVSDTNLRIRYISSILSICLMTFLGFADDVLNLRWRYKLILPAIAGLPVIVSYTGSSLVVIPKPLRLFLPFESLEFGRLYYLYLLALLLFCTNSINIYAGINGLEVGQSLVISFSLVAYHIYHLFTSSFETDSHYLALSLLLPFCLCSMGLFQFNKYPSKVFVGDSFTYFAGITLAVSAIVGEFTKLLLLLFIPQLVNFLYSLPQLIGIVPCPRHRLPTFDPETGKLIGVPTHLNLINLVLKIAGPMHERSLFLLLMSIQIVFNIFGLVVRELLARHQILYD
ncbi:hypothetical protein GEMRC1_013684 [Eukaryota sp. GEM-RC1]